MTVRITTMTGADLDFALAMSDAENWGYLRKDFDRLTDLQPDGCFVAHNRFRRIGIITTSSHGDYGFMGTLIVGKRHRKRGIGEALFVHAQTYLANKGSKTIELDGVYPAVSLYRRLGFIDKYLSLRFVRPPASGGAKLSPLVPISVHDLLRFDREVTGVDRSAVLSRFHKDFTDSLFSLGESRLSAYAFVRPRADGRMTIGPLVAKSTDEATRLLKSILSRFGDRALSIGVPEGKPEFVRALLSEGFLYSQPSLRMYSGTRVESECCVYGFIAPEVG